MRHEIYTYEGFLKAVAKFPAFCGESNLVDYEKDLDMTCTRELAVMFSHWVKETGGHNSHIETPLYLQALESTVNPVGGKYMCRGPY